MAGRESCNSCVSALYLMESFGNLYQNTALFVLRIEQTHSVASQNKAKKENVLSSLATTYASLDATCAATHLVENASGGVDLDKTEFEKMF